MNKCVKRGLGYAFVHFATEVVCFWFLYSRLHAESFWWAFALLFDALAFIPQSMIGLFDDKYHKRSVGVFGGLFVLLALLIRVDVVSLVLIALGNAAIHVSGAQATLRGAEGKVTPNALFVGGGSFGVVTGQLLGMWAKEQWILLPIALMLLAMMVMLCISRDAFLYQRHTGFDIAADISIWQVVALAFLAVAVRGYIGYAIPTDWNKTISQTIALFVSMGIGKMLGGILADAIGFRIVTYISLLCGLPFLLFGNTTMALSLIGIALFSMTMPITIAVLVSKLPQMPGFAFGVTTVGLFVGVAPAFFVQPQTLLAHQLVVIILTAVALPSLIRCIKKGR